MHGQKRKSWYALVLFHIFIHFLERIRSDQNLHIFKTTYLIFVNLQVVASGKKCSKFYWLPPDKENTRYINKSMVTQLDMAGKGYFFVLIDKNPFFNECHVYNIHSTLNSWIKHTCLLFQTNIQKFPHENRDYFGTRNTSIVRAKV